MNKHGFAQPETPNTKNPSHFIAANSSRLPTNPLRHTSHDCKIIVSRTLKLGVGATTDVISGMGKGGVLDPLQGRPRPSSSYPRDGLSAPRAPPDIPVGALKFVEIWNVFQRSQLQMMVHYPPCYNRRYWMLAEVRSHLMENVGESVNKTSQLIKRRNY